MYTVTTVLTYTVNGRSIQQRLTRYNGNDAAMAERMIYLCTPQDTPVNVVTDNGKTTITFSNKD
jgi:hypothetical protein